MRDCKARSWRRLILCCAAIATHGALRPTAAAAQTQPDGGFWIGFGFSGGEVHVTCDCGPLATSTMGMYIHAGGTISRQIIVGGEFSFWMDDYAPTFKESAQGDTSGSGLTVLSSYYPFARRPFFVVGGIGVNSVDVRPLIDDEQADSLLIESYAGALRVGIGYELRLRNSLKLRPEFLHIRTFGEEVDEGGKAVQRRLAPRVTMIQVGLTWR